MAESATLGRPADLTEPDVAPWPLGVIFRDIARGGLAGLAVGVVVGGLGGRVAMRLIALLIPEATGRPTENGNRIGDITLGGSLGLIIFAGLFAGIVVGTIWVVVSPWLPRSLRLRVLAAIPLAIGLGAFVLIQGSNSDFLVLGYELVVVVVLLCLVGLVGASMAVVDALLDRRLPRARSTTSPESGFYFAISLIGSLVAVLVAVGFLAGPLRPARDRPVGQRHRHPALVVPPIPRRRTAAADAPPAGERRRHRGGRARLRTRMAAHPAGARDLLRLVLSR